MTGVPRAVAALSAAWMAALLAASCGGRVSQDEGQTIAPGTDAGRSDSSVTSDAGDGGKKDGSTKPPPKDGGHPPDAGDGGKDALPDYVDPGCPDAGAPLENYECNPYGASEQECGQGLTCYPYVNYPSEPCGQEEYGATCIFAGSNGQGDPCGTGCKASHICVVSGQGTQCVQVCDLNDPNPCSDGLVCEPVDIPGIGGCL